MKDLSLWRRRDEGTEMQQEKADLWIQLEACHSLTHSANIIVSYCVLNIVLGIGDAVILKKKKKVLATCSGSHL